MGRLFVIEGIDGSGKSTQLTRLKDAFERDGREYMAVRFPQYDKRSSELVRMYLAGEFGTDPDDVNAYAASSFYAVDRFASFKTQWEGSYWRGVTIICDRYTTSNAVHQAGKLEGGAREEYLRWLFDYEYSRLKLPRPDAVFYLDMPVDTAVRLIGERKGKPDIHENDIEYLRRCREAALLVCEIDNWHRVPCVENGRLRTEDEIHTEIYGKITKLIGDNVC